MDLVTFTEEIFNEKLHFCVQCEHNFNNEEKLYDFVKSFVNVDLKTDNSTFDSPTKNDFDTFTAEGSSETRRFMHLSKHVNNSKNT